MCSFRIYSYLFCVLALYLVVARHQLVAAHSVCIVGGAVLYESHPTAAVLVCQGYLVSLC